MADANIVIAAVLRTSTVQKLLFNAALEPYAPEYLFAEIGEHREEFRRRAGYDEQAFLTALSLARHRIHVVCEPEYRHLLAQAIRVCPDKDDVPYAALSMLVRCPLWTNDRRLIEDGQIETVTTAQLISLLQGRYEC